MLDSSNVLLLCLFVIAIAVGFLLGYRRGKRRQQRRSETNVNRAYYRGLNFLLNEQPDRAVDAFVESLAVDDSTLETHLALGKLMRKQGQVDRAIRIHQNLLARPTLDPRHQHQAHLELARDFLKAGLLDRAELLLNEVIGESAELRGIAQRYLLDIYQDESEWQQAITVGTALLGTKYVKSRVDQRLEFQRMVAHFHCELALKADGQAAKSWLNKALAADKSCARATMQLAELSLDEGLPKQALKWLKGIPSQDASLFAESLPLMRASYLALDALDGYHNTLLKHLRVHRDPIVRLYLIDSLLSTQQYEEGRVEIEKALADEPILEDVERYLALGALQSDAADVDWGLACLLYASG
ncbi:lipopolysaccharide assembly protein LapB [bacterium]|nr:lipopolysaccharide assembly protein LapB [bacterium]